MNLTITADFMRDLRDASIMSLKQYGIRYKNKDSTETLLIKLYSTFQRLIQPRNYDVFYSRELSEKLPSMPRTVQTAVGKLENWLKTGVDINCYQSRGLLNQGSRDYQYSRYRITHLHLSAKEEDSVPNVKKDGFSKSSDYLLYACFQDDRAYFLDVGKHPPALSEKSLSERKTEAAQWVSRDFMKIIRDNWPELSQPIEALSVWPKLSDEDIADLTAHNINTFTELEDGLYQQGLGVTASGDDAEAVLHATLELNRVVRSQAYFHRMQDVMSRDMRRLLNANNRKIPENVEVHYDFFLYYNRFFIVERTIPAVWDETSNLWFPYALTL